MTSTALDCASVLGRLATLTIEFAALSANVHALIAEARAHWAGEQQRFQLIDRFIDPALNLDGVLQQIVDGQQQILMRLAEIQTALAIVPAPYAPSDAASAPAVDDSARDR